MLHLYILFEAYESPIYVTCTCIIWTGATGAARGQDIRATGAGDQVYGREVGVGVWSEGSEEKDYPADQVW